MSDTNRLAKVARACAAADAARIRAMETATEAQAAEARAEEPKVQVERRD